jgi:hypothetical protein
LLFIRHQEHYFGKALVFQASHYRDESLPFVGPRPVIPYGKLRLGIS